MWEFGGERGWHSHAQICQGISSKGEGFVHIMSKLEHTAKEQRGHTQPGCVHLEPREAALAIPAPAASTTSPPLLPFTFLSLPTALPHHTQDLTIFSSGHARFPDCSWRH